MPYRIYTKHDVNDVGASVCRIVCRFVALAVIRDIEFYFDNRQSDRDFVRSVLFAVAI